MDNETFYRLTLEAEREGVSLDSKISEHLEREKAKEQGVD